MTDWIIITLLLAIWFQGTRYSREFSNQIDRAINTIKRFIRSKLGG